VVAAYLSVSFIVSQSMVTLSNSKPASAGIFRDSYLAQEHDTRDILYYIDWELRKITKTLVRIVGLLFEN
jgi:hypothetical protein